MERAHGSWTHLLVAAMTLLALAPSHSAAAARGTVEVIDLLPEAYDRTLLAKGLSLRARREVRLAPIPASLLAQLRWAYPDPARSACSLTVGHALERLGLSAPARPVPSVLMQRLLDQARTSLLLVDYRNVLDLLEMARNLVPCLETAITPQTEVRLFEYEAVAYLFMNDPRADTAFADLAAITAAPQIDPGYPPAVTDALLHAFKASLRMPRVRLDTTSVLDEVLVDGIPIERSPGLLPGRHVVQFLGPLGAVRGRLVTLAPDQEVFVPADVDVGLMTREEVRATLARAMLQNTLSEIQAAALQRYLNEQGARDMVVAVEGAPGTPPTFLVYRPATGTEPWLPPSATEAPHQVTLALAASSQFLQGSGHAFAANGAAVGMALTATLPAGTFEAIGDLALYPYMLHAPDRTACGSYTGDAPPTDEEILQEAACLPDHTLFGLAAGAGRPFTVRGHLHLTPALMLRTTFLPNTLVPGSDDTIDALQVTRSVLLGPEARLRTTWLVHPHRLSPIVAFDLQAATLLGRTQGISLRALLLGATCQVGAFF